MATFYGEDLTAIHHTGFGAFATGAAPGLLALLREAGIHEGLVVDLGCGSGLWARALSEAGYAVLGVDCSLAMIALARSVAPAARLVEASQYEVELPRCAAVTAIGEGLGYIGPQDPREALAPLFSRVYRALSPGGLFIFDVVLRSRRAPMCYRAAHEGEDWRTEVVVAEAPRRSSLTRQIRTTRWVDGVERQSEETHQVRTFSRSELERALRGCGFTVRVHRRYGAMPLPPQRLAFRARKPSREIRRRQVEARADAQ